MDDFFTRIWSALEPIGMSDGGGYRRFSFTPVDALAREWFTSTARELGLEVETDRNGNLWAWWEGPWGDRHSDRQLVLGSHLDSVPDGGAFDGPLGVASALAAIHQLKHDGFLPDRAIGVAVFAEEEGARFGVACLGSRLATGALTPERALALTDADGVTLDRAMSAAAIDPAGLGADPDRMSRIAAFIELHIEQGRAEIDQSSDRRGLVDAGSPLGLATNMWPHGRWRAEFRGTADHAGTTMLDDRDDAMLAFAEFVVRVRAAAAAHGALATVGRIDVEPNGTNAIASRVTCWLDVRAAEDSAVDRVLAELADAGFPALIADSRTPAVIFDPTLLDAASAALGALPRLGTGAGHDAAILSDHGVPSLMLFVRNRTGVSHSPLESASREDCVAGVRALATLIESACFGAVTAV
jgi:N-carbamoyl-L-amino-acid hydrolase